MLSLFCVLVCVLAQLSNNTVHPTVIVASKKCLSGFIGFNLVVDMIERNASEDSSRANPQTVCFSKIYPALNQGAVQIELIRKAVFDKVSTSYSASQLAARTTG